MPCVCFASFSVAARGMRLERSIDREVDHGDEEEIQTSRAQETCDQEAGASPAESEGENGASTHAGWRHRDLRRGSARDRARAHRGASAAGIAPRENGDTEA